MKKSVTHSFLTFYEWLSERPPGPEEMAARSEQRNTVWQALGQLSPRQRAAVVQRYYLEMSEAEMAEQMDVAPGTVKWHLHQARERLRTLLVSPRNSEIER